MMRSVRASLLALTCAALAAGCAKEPNPDIETPPSDAGRAVPLTADTAPVGAPAGAPAAGPVTDANIAAIASASNQDEIQTSTIALQKATRPEVRQFAQRMVDEHTRVEQQMQQALQAKGLQPQDNAQSQQMKQAMQTTIAQLQAATAEQFDAAYLAHQVQAHQTTLQALRTTLIPNARDPQLKQMLQGVEPAVAEHLRMAQQLQAGAAPAAATAEAAPAPATAAPAASH